MNSGWIKLHRKLLKNSLWEDCTPEQKVIMITLLLMANHNEKKWIFSGEEYECKPGQFVTSLPSIQKEVGKGVSIMQIRRTLDKLEKYNFLTCKPTNKNRLITIVNWEAYQNEKTEPTDEPTGNRQATDRQPTPNKNIRMKECKNIKSNKENSSKKTDVISDYTSNENLRKTILAFKDMRKTIKKPLTDHALKLLLNKLDKLEDSDSGKIAVLEQSIMNSWQGVFELKGQAKQEVVREIERKEGVKVGVIQKI